MRTYQWLALLAALPLIASCGGGGGGGGGVAPKKDEPGFVIEGGDLVTTSAEACKGCHDETTGGAPISAVHDPAPAGFELDSQVDSVTITEIAEVTEVTVVGDVAGSLNNTWFSLDAAGTAYYVWYDVGGGGTNPSPGGTGIPVAIATDDTAATVANKTATAINGVADFTATDDGVDTVTVSNVSTGVSVDADNGAASPGFTFNVTFQGGDTVTVVASAFLAGTATPYEFLASNDLRFTFAELIDANNDTRAAVLGGSGRAYQNWECYFQDEEVKEAGDPGITANGTTTTQCTYDRPGSNNLLAFVNNADGTYTYTFSGGGFDASGDPVPINADGTRTFEGLAAKANTHRVSLQVSDGVSNGWADFTPTAGVQTLETVNPDRAIVQTGTCNECHAVEGSTANGGGLAMHGGSRRDVEYCVTCHNPTSVDANSGESVDLKVMLHKIHLGKGLESVAGREDSGVTIIPGGDKYRIWGYRDSEHDYSLGTFPQPVQNCQKCHTGGAQAANWQSEPTQETCGACHDRTWFGPVASTPSGWRNHTGGAQTDNAGCTGCHPATSTTDKKAVANAHPWAQVVTAASAYDYVIDSVTYAGSALLPSVTGIVTDGAGTTATITFGSAHGFLAGATVTVSGADQSFFNGKVTITATPTTTTAEYAVAGTASTTATTSTQLVAERQTRELQVVFRVQKSAANRDLGTDPEWIAPFGASRLAMDVGWRDSGKADYTNDGAGDGSTPGTPLGFDLLCPLTQPDPTCGADDSSPPSGYTIDGDLNGYILTTRLPSDGGRAGTGIVMIEGHPAEPIPSGGTDNERLPVPNVYVEFAINDAAPDARRATVVDADIGAGKCENCHDTLSLHGENRTPLGFAAASVGIEKRGIVICTVCHNSANSDLNRRPSDLSLTDDNKAEEAIDFKYLIHRIHAGRDTTDGFIEVWGFGGSKHVFAGEFPPGNRLANCTNCHNATPTIPLVSGLEGTTIDSGSDVVDHDDDLNISPNTATCSSCHDSAGAIVHMLINGGNMSVKEDDILFY